MIAAANRHDVDGLVAEFSEDYENVTPIHPAQSFTGREQVRRNWENLFGGVPDIQVVVHDATTAADGTVWMEWGNTGTRSDGVVVEMAGVAIFAVREERIVGVHFYLEPVDHRVGDVTAAVRNVTDGGKTPLAAVGALPAEG
jgi:ketosteroid isomerase-like protein